MSNQQSLGIQLAQLGRDASAAVSIIDVESMSGMFGYVLGEQFSEKCRKLH